MMKPLHEHPIVVDPLTEASPILPKKLKRSASFEPCAVDAGEEIFSNGIFQFNITRLMAFLESQPNRFPPEIIAVAGVSDYGDSNLDQATIAAADVTRPVLFAEIGPGRFNLIDGNHRMARARRDSVAILPAYRVRCPHHMAFLTSTMAYEKYVEYWNGKVREMVPKSQCPRRQARSGSDRSPRLPSPV